MIPLSLINNEDVARIYLLENSDTYHIEDIEVKNAIIPIKEL
jgi:hypothetical protein